MKLIGDFIYLYSCFKLFTDSKLVYGALPLTGRPSDYYYFLGGSILSTSQNMQRVIVRLEFVLREMALADNLTKYKDFIDLILFFGDLLVELEEFLLSGKIPFFVEDMSKIHRKTVDELQYLYNSLFDLAKNFKKQGFVSVHDQIMDILRSRPKFDKRVTFKVTYEEVKKLLDNIKLLKR